MDSSGGRISRMQEKIMSFIRESVQETGVPPSLREIGNHVGLVSTSSVSYQLQQLEARGLIKRGFGKSRAIQLVNGAESTLAQAWAEGYAYRDPKGAAPLAGDNPYEDA